jgi:CelD/BcsL family acetyltransferase involved in cellulose biosynthesis
MENVSPVLELSGGWDAYVQRLCLTQRTQSPGILSTLRASLKRIERDIGPVRFEMREKSQVLLNELMRLKSEQSIRTMSTTGDPFSERWVRQLLADGLASMEDDFGASLSTLYAGDKLLALHYGLRSGPSLHSWFPVFDPAYAYYQPGLLLLRKIIETGCQQGLTLIDLGRGTASYKMRFKTSVVRLGEGAVSRPALIAQGAMTEKIIKLKIKSNPTINQFRKWLHPEVA